jgi:signal recognition particle subunit SRP54
MVLGELGTKITSALRKLNNSTNIDEEALKECLKEVTTALLQSDVNISYVVKLRDSVITQYKAEAETAGTNKRKIIQKAVVSELQNLLDVSKKPYKLVKGKSNVVMFVGLQGSGKTTTCTKYAYFYQKKGYRVALVCADTFRAGAFDQLKMNATRVKIPFYGSYTETNPVQIATEGVEHFRNEGYDLIIVDTSGRHKQEESLFREMEDVAASIDPNEIIFVMDSSIGQSCLEQAMAFKKSVKVGSVIVTKLDGHAKGGGALSAVAATESPIIFIGTGEQFDDFEEFDAKSFIKRLLGLGDIDKLFSVVQEAVPMDKQPELLNKIQHGQFTLRDMYEQFQSVLKMGSISQVMSLIPGISSSLLEKGREKEGIARIKRFMCMMDSMTDDELDGHKPMVPTRIIRVARGSGTSVKEVEILLEEYKRFAKMVKKMGKLNLGKANDMQNFMRNPNDMMRKVQSAVDPKLLKQFGGTQNMMNLMKEMSKMDMGEMMGMLGGKGRGKRR